MTNIQSVKLRSYMGSTDNTCLIVTLTDNKIIYVPQSADNTDYQQYLAWLAEGNEPLPADEPPTE